MNSSNLISALPPHEYKKWRNWIWCSSVLIGALIMLLSIMTAVQLLSWYKVRNEAQCLTEQVTNVVHEENKNIKKQLKKNKKRRKKVTAFSHKQDYSAYLIALANSIPASMRFSSITIDAKAIELKGEINEIELLLDCIQTLEKTNLFQAMNLIELLPSSISKDEKKLIQFTSIGNIIS